MNKLILLSAIFLALLTGTESCKNGNNAKGTNDSTNRSTALKFGTAVIKNAAVAIPEMVKKMDTLKRMDCTIQGTVSAVCKEEGCWLELDRGNGQALHLDWDHQFFVPKDIEGRKVYATGYAYVKTSSVKELQHIAEDAGQSKAEIDAIKAPREQLRFKATGLIIE